MRADTLVAMPRCIAFLRAVNVGGRFVKMERLRTEFEALGLTGVQTFIASGNVVFDTRARDLAALALRIEAHLHATFGYEIHTFLRTPAEVAAIARRTPFAPADVAAAKTWVVGFVAEPFAPAARGQIERFESATDRFVLDGRELYWLSPHSQAETRFSNAAFEKALGVRATFRGMNTVQRLAAAHAGGLAAG